MHHPLTREAQTRLTRSLETFGNTLTLSHKIALAAMLDTFTQMATGTLKGRWAFPLATGAGKTRAITEWATSVHTLGQPYSLVVSASRIQALCRLKKDLIDNGVPASKIGLVYVPQQDTKFDYEPTTDNENKPFLLCSHQLIRSRESNQALYNSYQGQPRSLVIYDESLLVSDIEHFIVKHLTGSLGKWLNELRFDNEQGQHTDICNWLTERLAIIDYVFHHFKTGETNVIPEPSFALSDQQAVEYERLFRKTDSVMADFVAIKDLPLLMSKYGKTAVISYKVVIPEALQNMVVLDASYPIRSLEREDLGLLNAETLPVCVQHRVKFDTLKQFDQVTLYRMAKRGSRHAAVSDKTRMKNLMKDTVEVIKSIPTGEGVLIFVYKRKDNRDPQKVLSWALADAKLDKRKDVYVQTWGNETSLNDYRQCRHVILVGILHRDLSELEAQLRGQRKDMVNHIPVGDLHRVCLSERAHCAYQALSRGACRNSNNGQAFPMTGYIIEFDEGLETELNKVMPGVAWKEWKPMFSDLAEHGKLTRSIAGKLQKYLIELPEDVSKISSRRVWSDLGLQRVTRETRAQATRLAMVSCPLWSQDERSFSRTDDENLSQVLL